VSHRPAGDDVDVLLVGAGPTGLALAVQAERHGASVRVVDRTPGPVHESRALVVQPRTLELLAGCGVTDELVHGGRSTVRLVLHAGTRAVPLPLFDFGLDDSPYPHLLFLSQAETEPVLGAHLAARGVEVERDAELVGIEQDAETVQCRLSTVSGERVVTARHVVGSDGAASTVRRLVDVPFVGGRYPQRFALADLELDGLETGAGHSYLAARGILFFPLGHPASWRLLGILPRDAPTVAARRR
jgi:2-polyprenyl-6-methoxyphenol hydroxylase-like FAD-dependent oxidoreductase